MGRNIRRRKFANDQLEHFQNCVHHNHVLNGNGEEKKEERTRRSSDESELKVVVCEKYVFKYLI